MRPAALAFLLLVAAASFWLGWLHPGQVEGRLQLTRHPHPAAVQSALPNPNAETLAALDQLGGALAGPPPPRPVPSVDPEGAPRPPPRAVKPVALPAPPDVGLLFRRQISAVVRRDGGLGVLLVDSTGETRQTRLLKVGDVYMGSWRLAALTPDEAVLRDGREERRVALFVPPSQTGGE